MLNKIVHFEIGCRDRAALAPFYSGLFDWQLEDNPVMTLIKTGGDVNGLLNQLGHEPHNYTIFYVEVEDLPASIAKTEELGGRLVVGPIQYAPGRSFAWVTDPEGNMLGLHRGQPSD